MAGQSPLSLYQIFQPQLTELNQMCTEFARLMEQTRKSNSDDVIFETEHWRLAYEEKQCDILEIRKTVAVGYTTEEDLRTRNEESVNRYLNFISRYSESDFRRAQRRKREAELTYRRDIILSIILDIEISMDTKVNTVIGDLLHSARVLIGVEGASKNGPRRGRGRPCHSVVQVQGQCQSALKRGLQNELFVPGPSIVKRRKDSCQDSNTDSSGSECVSESSQAVEDDRPSVIRFAAFGGESSEAECVEFDGEVNLVSSRGSDLLEEVTWAPIGPS